MVEHYLAFHGNSRNGRLDPSSLSMDLLLRLRQAAHLSEDAQLGSFEAIRSLLGLDALMTGFLTPHLSAADVICLSRVNRWFYVRFRRLVLPQFRLVLALRLRRDGFLPSDSVINPRELNLSRSLIVALLPVAPGYSLSGSTVLQAILSTPLEPFREDWLDSDLDLFVASCAQGPSDGVGQVRKILNRGEFAEDYVRDSRAWSEMWDTWPSVRKVLQNSTLGVCLRHDNDCVLEVSGLRRPLHVTAHLASTPKKLVKRFDLTVCANYYLLDRLGIQHFTDIVLRTMHVNPEYDTSERVAPRKRRFEAAPRNFLLARKVPRLPNDAAD